MREAPRPDPSQGPRGTVKVAPLTAADFTLRIADPHDGQVRLRTVAKPRFTQWGEARVAVTDGIVEVPTGTILMAMVHRHGRRPAVPELAILEEWGTWQGALATTVSHDSHNLSVFGRDPADMAVAANAVIAAGGGMSVAMGGELLSVLPLPICGLLSDAPTSEVAEGFRALKAAADRIADWQPPLRVFKSVLGASLACNLGPHLTDLGLTDGGTGEIRPLVVAAE